MYCALSVCNAMDFYCLLAMLWACAWSMLRGCCGGRHAVEQRQAGGQPKTHSRCCQGAGCWRAHAACPTPHPRRSEIIELPPGALQGLREGVADKMLAGERCAAALVAADVALWIAPLCRWRGRRRRDAQQESLALGIMKGLRPRTCRARF